MARNPLTHQTKCPSHPACDLNARHLRTSSRRLWTAVRITALPAHGVRLPAPLPTSQPSEQASRRLWTAGRITALSACGARLPAPSVQARAREAPYSPLSPPALRTSQPQALDCWENHSSLCVRSTPTRPPHKPGHARLRSRPSPHKPPPNKPAEGSGLLGESQLSLRAEHACQPSPHKPGHARLRTRASPHKPFQISNLPLPLPLRAGHNSPSPLSQPANGGRCPPPTPPITTPSLPAAATPSHSQIPPHEHTRNRSTFPCPVATDPIHHTRTNSICRRTTRIQHRSAICVEA